MHAKFSLPIAITFDASLWKAAPAHATNLSNRAIDLEEFEGGKRTLKATKQTIVSFRVTEAHSA